LLQNSVEQLDANLSSALDMNASIRTYDEESRLAIGGHLALLVEELQFHCDRSRLLLITRLSSDLKRRIEGQRLMNDNVSRNYSTISTALALSRDMKMLIIDLREVLRDPSNLFIRSGVQSALMAASAWMTSQDSMASFSAASTVAATSSLLKYANGRRVDADAPLPGYGTAPSSADINLHLRPFRFGKRYSSDYERDGKKRTHFSVKRPRSPEDSLESHSDGIMRREFVSDRASESSGPDVPQPHTAPTTSYGAHGVYVPPSMYVRVQHPLQCALVLALGARHHQR
jgi:hypothetical protein